jgi:hypothetical protein
LAAGVKRDFVIVISSIGRFQTLQNTNELW